MSQPVEVSAEPSPFTLVTGKTALIVIDMQRDFLLPASRRLGFRELGLAIGLAAVRLMEIATRATPKQFSGNWGAEVRALLDALRPFVELGAALESFWLDPDHQEARAWSEHRDINEVMLATSLVPEGVLILTGC